ncbi:hypothetical protein AB0L42_37990 [Streptomyces sp. NPDC052287]|uniref:hypothetical protein n=1 Tax=Streptomyces sp. NPDC052287 TaxID=3154950 RepID=UPI0034173A10
METTRCALDGWIEAIPAPGPHGTVTFDLVVRPPDADSLLDDAPDTIISCTSDSPPITHKLLNATDPGALVRATGTMIQPQTPGENAHLTIEALEILDGLEPKPRAGRYGNYYALFDFDAGTDAVSVFTAGGRWVGLADNVHALTALIDIDQRVNGGDA